MSYEVEQKYRVAGFEPLRERLTSLGAEQGDVIVQVDTYFNHPQRDFAVTDEALRIRQVGERNFITFKGPKENSQAKTRYEREVALGAGADAAGGMADVLVRLGFRQVIAVEKCREPWKLTWRDWPVELVLDDVAEVGTFAEVEVLVPSLDELPAAEACLAGVAVELGLEQIERRSYLEMLLETQA